MIHSTAQMSSKHVLKLQKRMVPDQFFLHVIQMVSLGLHILKS